MATKVKMRPVNTSQSKRSYNKVIDGQDNSKDDRFQSMYSQAYGENIAVNHWAGQAMDTTA